MTAVLLDHLLSWLPTVGGILGAFFYGRSMVKTEQTKAVLKDVEKASVVQTSVAAADDVDLGKLHDKWTR